MNTTIENIADYFCDESSTYYKDFYNYLQKTILEANKLSDKGIKDLCLEYLRWIYDKPSLMPKIKIGIYTNPISYCDCRLQYYWEQLVSIIHQYTKGKNNIIGWEFKDYNINPVKDLKLIFPFNTENLYYRTGGGILNMRFYKLIYYFDFLGIPIQDETLKRFWEFYKKTLNVYAMGIHHFSTDLYEIHVMKKPDEIFLRDNITHCQYEGKCYCDGIYTLPWLYKATGDNLDIKIFHMIKNIDYRTIFLKKAGIQNLIKIGKVIDSYENYPDNEWWAKSEYKLIDMSEITVQEIVKYRTGENVFKYYRYAPYLCMKNQTTGEIHMEGVSPDCKDLYDALKMRYDLLDLSEYKIEDIK